MAECGGMGRQLAQFDSLCAVWGNKLAVEAGRQEDRRCRVCLICVLRSAPVLDWAWNGRCQRRVVQHAGDVDWRVYCKTTGERVI